MTEWGSPEMQRAIRRHDKAFARKHGSVYGEPKRGCSTAAALTAFVPLTVWAAWSLTAGGIA